MKKIAILASGSGTNAENIYKFFANGNRVTVDLIIYDRASAGVVERMRPYGVETLYIPPKVWRENPEEIVDLLKDRNISLVVLAGFLRVIPKQLTDAFTHRMVNLHPSLLPDFGGMGMFGHKVHEAVIAAGEKKSGVTIHYVSEDVDGGEILMQEAFDLNEGETPESLEERIHQLEYALYPRAIVEALRRIKDSENSENPEISDHSPLEEWAETLKVPYNPEKIKPLSTPPSAPPIPENRAATIPPMPNNHPETEEQHPMPKTYLIWAVIMTVICCLPAGIIAIIFSSQVSSRYYAGDLAGAEKASERAQIWIIVAFVLGVMTNTLYIPLSLLFN